MNSDWFHERKWFYTKKRHDVDDTLPETIMETDYADDIVSSCKYTNPS